MKELIQVKIFDNSANVWYQYIDVSKYVFDVFAGRWNMYEVAITPNNIKIFTEIRPLLQDKYGYDHETIEEFIDRFFISPKRARPVGFKNNKEASMLLSQE